MKPKAVAWKAFSAYIRKRTPYCEFHDNAVGLDTLKLCGCAGVLQCCHKVSRSKNSILFDERNVFAGCAASNIWATYHQLDWAILWRKLWPNDLEHLELCQDIVTHRKSKDYLAIADHYKRQLKALAAVGITQDGSRVKNVIGAGD